MPDVSVLIVTHGRASDLERCLKSVEAGVIAAKSGGLSHEIIVVLNGVCPKTSELLERMPHLISLSIPRCSPAAARNHGLERASGEFVVFLDDDAAVPESYFSRAMATIADFPSVEILGGPDVTFPDAGLREQAIGLALRSPLATGKTRLRHGSARNRWSASAGSRAGAFDANEDALILCNLWIRRRLFSEEGFRFDGHFWRNEENVLLHQLEGRRALHDPEMFVYHRRKTRMIKFLRANFYSGYFRAKSFWNYPRSIRFHFFVPSMFLIFLVVPVRSPEWAVVWWAIVSLYVVLNLTMAGLAWTQPELRISGAWGRALELMALVALYQAIIIFAYGAGFIVGGISLSPVTAASART
jgi:glycosyltransferase involved in cell wall biosynthesis